MRLVSGPVLVGGVLLGSPALWAAATGTLSPDVAALRLGLCVVLAWLALLLASVLVSALGPRVPDEVEAEMQRPADVGLEKRPAPVDVMTGSSAGRVTAVDSPAVLR